MHSEGLDREGISLRVAESVITPYIMNESGSMQKSLLVSNGLINYHLPFLPLESKHVRKCILEAIQVSPQIIKFNIGEMYKGLSL